MRWLGCALWVVNNVCCVGRGESCSRHSPCCILFLIEICFTVFQSYLYNALYFNFVCVRTSRISESKAGVALPGCYGSLFVLLSYPSSTQIDLGDDLSGAASVCAPVGTVPTKNSSWGSADHWILPRIYSQKDEEMRLFCFAIRKGSLTLGIFLLLQQ